MPRPVTSIRRTLLLGLSFACLLLLPQTLRAQAPGAVHAEYHQDYFLYEPAEGSNFSRDTMPLVVYLHGAPWFIEPILYDTLMREIASEGCVVVLPIYKVTDPEDENFWPWNWYAFATQQTRTALHDVVSGRAGNWRPRYSNLALAGHSLGGMYALKMADEASDGSLPNVCRPRPRPSCCTTRLDTTRSCS
jgi:acetyl esterase/lipase